MMATASERHEPAAAAAAAAAGPACWWRPIGWTKILARLMGRALVAWGIPESDRLMRPTLVIRSLFPRCCAGIRAQSDPQPFAVVAAEAGGEIRQRGHGPEPRRRILFLLHPGTGAEHDPKGPGPARSSPDRLNCGYALRELPFFSGVDWYGVLGEPIEGP
jgi:hypothetical protein